jgi:hypothetical protein
MPITERLAIHSCTPADTLPQASYAAKVGGDVADAQQSPDKPARAAPGQRGRSLVQRERSLVQRGRSLVQRGRSPGAACYGVAEVEPAGSPVARIFATGSGKG